MKLKSFVSDVLAEAKLLQFPKWKETYISAITVSVTVFVFSLLIMLMDFVSSRIILSIFGL